MLSRKLWIAWVVLLGVVSGCREVSTPQEPVTSSQSEASSAEDRGPQMRQWLAELDIDTQNAAGVFSLGWRMPRADAADPSPRGHTMAVAFGEAQDNGRRPRIDMGAVSLVTPGATIELLQHTRRRQGVIYSSRRGRDVEPAAIEFVGNATYEFDVTGSDAFAAAHFSVTSPSELIAITSPASGGKVAGASDLVIQWQGGGDGKTVVAIAASTGDRKPGPRGRRAGRGGDGWHGNKRGMGRHGFRPVNRFHAVLDGNPGEYTVTADALAEIIGDSGATRLGIHVFQINGTEINHDGGTLWALVRTGDHVRVGLE